MFKHMIILERPIKEGHKCPDEMKLFWGKLKVGSQDLGLPVLIFWSGNL